MKAPPVSWLLFMSYTSKPAGLAVAQQEIGLTGTPLK
jgi:hypothetical protein